MFVLEALCIVLGHHTTVDVSSVLGGQNSGNSVVIDVDSTPGHSSTPGKTSAEVKHT